MTGPLEFVAVVAVGLLIAREMVAMRPTASQANTGKWLGWSAAASVAVFGMLLLLRLIQILAG